MKYILLIFLPLLFISCSSSIPTLNKENLLLFRTNNPYFSNKDFIYARNSFVSRCSSCHSLPNPQIHTKDEWIKLLPEMLVESKAKEDEKILITSFILSFAKN